jgi:dihydrolipoamide dehydrogenase
MNKYDILIIGGGPGGYVSAIKASQLGAKVALIEGHKIGGVCLNYGCIPTKSYLKSAKVFDFLKNASHYGLSTIPENYTFDWKQILLRKNKIVQQLTNGISFLLKKNKIDVYNNYAEALNPNQVKVGEQILNTSKLIIATGSSPFMPPIPGLQESFRNKFLFTSNEIINLETFPKKIIIIGGGVIGVEFASIFSKFGAEVIIIEKQSRILNSMDSEITKEYAKILNKFNVKILLEKQVIKIKDNSVFYSYKSEDNIEKVQMEKSDIILVAIGTKPNLKGLEKLNLQIDKIGIETDNFLRTSIEGVYAIGDVNGKYMLAHVASHEGIIAVSHALNSISNIKPMNYNHIPSCVYGFPEIASIGKTEEKVKSQNINYKVSKFPVKAIGKALADGETEGFAKLIIDKKNLKILGMHILAYNATELITEIGVTMELEGTAHDVVHTIHPHPTLSELTLETFLGAIDKPIHF